MLELNQSNFCYTPNLQWDFWLQENCLQKYIPSRFNYLGSVGYLSHVYWAHDYLGFPRGTLGTYGLT